MASPMAVPACPSAGIGIRNVWEDNLEEEFMNIQSILPLFPYVAMDTEFPGIVARPLGNFRSQAEYLYASLRCNVDMLRIIQLGLTLCDEQGNFPIEGPCTWQFNFRFSLDEDAYAQESIDLLSKSGLDFTSHQRRGISVDHFGCLLIQSGLVMMSGITWISFHSIFDFGYLFKVMTCNPLPLDDLEFLQNLNIFFPRFYDIKLLMRVGRNLKGGLQDLADDLKIQRIGTQHQAGSDALLTAQVFFKLRELYFDNGKIDYERYANQLYGLTSLYNPASATGTSTGSNPFVVGSADGLLGTTPPTHILSSPLKKK